ncbi:hypothetical protein SAMN02745157_2515 [Kaistia soli DSM 19436]|uniref:Uncharacterized protein n=1 Tax=Kaistia soli DSM 19436 TaxID=1122133 RepID=A0A1M5CZT0_9HYPH|nr:hypothetical protein [Kaistia soli]SHF60154.1 hypothetical protein SAMN02745157_2515 [Kaistia soli DSM 19436]
MSAADLKQKGPAKAATFPDRGSHPAKGSSNMSSNITEPAAPAMKDMIEAFRLLEGAMCDTLHMADLASDVVCDALSDTELHRSITGKEDVVYMPALRVDRLIFVTTQAWVMVRDLHAAYYAALHGEVAS